MRFAWLALAACSAASHGSGTGISPDGGGSASPDAAQVQITDGPDALVVTNGSAVDLTDTNIPAGPQFYRVAASKP